MHLEKIKSILTTMFITLHTADYLIAIITFILAYIVAATFSGFIQSLVATYFGDESPREAGFLTLNPLQHIDPVGLILLALFGIGWSNYPPLNVHSYKASWQLVLTFFSRTLTLMGIAIVSILILMISFGAKILIIMKQAVFNYSVPINIFYQMQPASTPLLFSFQLILSRLIFVSILFAAINIIFQGFRFFILHYFQEVSYSRYGNIFLFLIPFFLFLLFLEPLRYIIGYIVLILGSFFAQILGIG